MTGHLINIYYGNWPWKVLSLSSPEADVADLWVRGLNVVLKSANQYFRGMDGRSNAREFYDNPRVDYWLKKRFTQVYRQHGGKVPIAAAISEFTGIAAARAEQVNVHAYCHIIKGSFT